MRIKLIGIISGLFLIPGMAQAAVPDVDENTDSVPEFIRQRASMGFLDNLVDYVLDAHNEQTQKPFDISFLGGPGYSTEKKWCLDVMAIGSFNTSRGDSLNPRSNVSIYVDGSTSGFYRVGSEGILRFKRDGIRVDYDANFFSLPDDYWGIGYADGINDADKTHYRKLQAECLVRMGIRVAPHLYLGPLMELTYIKGTNIDPEFLHLWNNEELRTFSYALGANIYYDTRDNLTAPHRGVYLAFTQRFYPAWMKNTYKFNSSEFTASYYTSLWKGATLATRFHAYLSYGNTPWGMLPTFGGKEAMRGYYQGRFRDKGEMDLTVELRQRIWWRFGVAAWGGAGNVFSRLSMMDWNHTLPNYGVGIRWEFKKNVNIRFDAGFGKDTYGFVFSINEAF